MFSKLIKLMLILTMITCTACNIKGTITDESGNPVEGVTLELTYSQDRQYVEGAEVLRTEVTDANGDYEFEGLDMRGYYVKPVSNTYTFDPDKSYATFTQSFNDKIRDFTALDPYYDISGEIVDADGNPVAGVQVTLNDLTNSDPSVAPKTTETDTSGSYIFEDLEPGHYSVVPSGSGKTFDPSSADIQLENSNMIADFTELSYAISGTISIDGQRTANISVILSSNGNDIASTTTDTNGAYRFTDLELNTSYTVIPQAQGVDFTPEYEDVYLESSVTVDFTGHIPPTYDLNGMFDLEANIALGSLYEGPLSLDAEIIQDNLNNTFEMICSYSGDTMATMSGVISEDEYTATSFSDYAQIEINNIAVRIQVTSLSFTANNDDTFTVPDGSFTVTAQMDLFGTGNWINAPLTIAGQIIGTR